MDKKLRLLCTNVSEVIQHTIRVQQKGLLNPATNLTRDIIRSQMRADCRALGIEDLDNALPPVVHVAGTKGKGSTCAFVDSILRQSNLRTTLFTSPHLVDVRERIRFNGKLLPSQEFDSHFMDTYRLLGVDRMEHIGFFQFLTLVLFRIVSLKRREIDVLILEVGIGGRLDFTNAIDHPLCCALTLFDLDHIALLGNTLKLIASEKVGIAKPQVPIFTLSSQPELDVVKEYCQSVGAPLKLVDKSDAAKFELGIQGKHQIGNASLALALCRYVLHSLRSTDHNEANLESAFTQGLKQCRFPGRTQVEKQGRLTYYLDGAHTPLSLESAKQWFLSQVPDPSKAVLVFHASADRVQILSQLVDVGFSRAYFVRPTSGPQSSRDLHEGMVHLWGSKTSQVWDRDVSELGSFLQDHDLNVDSVFVVGSFYLVGDALKFWIPTWNVEEAFV